MRKEELLKSLSSIEGDQEIRFIYKSDSSSNKYQVDFNIDPVFKDKKFLFNEHCICIPIIKND